MISTGRKFWLVVCFQSLCFFSFWCGVLTQDGFIDISKYALGGYLGANVIHYAASKIQLGAGAKNGVEN